MIRRGLARLFIVIAVPWCAYFGWELGNSMWTLRQLHPQIVNGSAMLKDIEYHASRGETLAGDGLTNELVLGTQRATIADLDERAYEQRQRRREATWFLVLGLAALGSALAALGWVMRGFRDQ